ncbi:MAG: hypothetical protein IPK77_13640 [Cellvibrio sp.]|nr:hypothetical protein [Cellvibrio sp.]
MKKILALFIVFSLQAYADNPGKSAHLCVTAGEGNPQPNGIEIAVENDCGAPVFILYCGELEFSSDRCGDGPDGGYYTHSSNIDEGEETNFRIEDGGSYSFGACYGQISFVNGGTYTDEPNGRYTCLPTGDYKQDE